MKSWSEQIRFSQPLKDVTLAPLPGSPEWEQRVLERERAAFERGRIEGERALSQQLVQQRSDLLELQNGVLTSLRQAMPKLVTDAEEALVQLAYSAALKIIAETPISTELVEAVVREALGQLDHEANIVVLLHPQDLELLRKINAPLLLEQIGGQPLRFQASPDITRGGCLLQTNFGTVDARRETKIERLRDSLAA